MLRSDTWIHGVNPQRFFHLAGPLGELAADPRYFREIPAYLQAALGLSGVTFAVVRAGDSADPAFLALHTATACDQYVPATMDPALARQVTQVALGRELLNDGPCPCQYQVLHRNLDPQYTLVLLIHCPPKGPGLAAETVERLQALTDYLARVVANTLSWQDSPAGLGQPFAGLTNREWAVLCGLRSGDGEKQLAGRLGLSPHTLHSHVKAIYRKVGVQGRLGLLETLERALRAYRTRMALEAQRTLAAADEEARKAS